MATQEITYREAVVAALQEEMRRDPKTLIMGEDIGPSGGPFKTCLGLYEEFGHARVRDTPIAETGFVGAALGLAITGYRPIVEIMFADFLGVCFDQIANSIAKHRFMSGGKVKVPIAIRAIAAAASLAQSIADADRLLRERALGWARAEAELADQREQFRVTLASIGDAVIATDMFGRVTFMNDVARSLTGWAEEPTVGRPLDGTRNDKPVEPSNRDT